MRLRRRDSADSKSKVSVSETAAAHHNLLLERLGPGSGLAPALRFSLALVGCMLHLSLWAACAMLEIALLPCPRWSDS